MTNGYEYLEEEVAHIIESNNILAFIDFASYINSTYRIYYKDFLEHSLNSASRKGSFKIIKYILKTHISDIDSNYIGYVIQYATYHNYFNIIKYMINNHSNKINKPSIEIAISNSIHNKKFGYIKCIIKKLPSYKYKLCYFESMYPSTPNVYKEKNKKCLKLYQDILDNDICLAKYKNTIFLS